MKLKLFLFTVLFSFNALGLEDGLYFWTVKDDDLKIEVVSLVKIDSATPPAGGNIFLRETAVDAASLGTETPVVLAKRGDSLWFAQKQSKMTYSLVYKNDQWVLTAYDYVQFTQKVLGLVQSPSFVGIEKLSSTEASCLELTCIKSLKEKFF